MKIIHAFFSFQTGGSETMVVDIMNRQCLNNSVYLLVINNNINTELLSTVNKEVKIVLLNREEGSKTQLLKCFYSIHKIVKKINPDIIHCHNYNLFPFFIRWKNRTILTMHSTLSPVSYLKYYKKIFSISATVQNDIKQRTGINSQLIFNGIEIADYKRKADYNLPDNQFEIIQVSRLDHHVKGQHIAIEALALLLEKHPDIKFTLTFAGSGPSEQKLKELVETKNLSENISFLGQVDRNWIKKNLKNYSLLIQPSFSEGFGLTIIEGFAAGLPVIASNINGPKELLDTLNAGILINLDPAELAENIYSVYKSYTSGDIKDSKYIIADSSKLSLFDIETTTQLYLDSYKEIRK